METGTAIALIVIFVVIAVFLLWWLLITTEGVYLGRRVVIYLYDIYARRYDKIKHYELVWESVTLGKPLFVAMLDVPAPLVLDVATGTARLPLALYGQPAFQGYVIGLDFSRKMLNVAAEKTAHIGLRTNLVFQPAQDLPFDDNTFDAVTCLEALEFMPNPDVVISEIVRVARPGAVILLTTRKGRDARLMPGKTMSREAFADHLRNDFGLKNVTLSIWQMDYDQVWATKSGNANPAPEHALENVLRCPGCGKPSLLRIAGEARGLRCMECESWIPIGDDGVIEYANAQRSIEKH